MRDPNRIPKMIAALQKAWYQNPDLRLGQLVSNAGTMTRTSPDPFYVEDDQMLKALEQYPSSGF